MAGNPNAGDRSATVQQALSVVELGQQATKAYARPDLSARLATTHKRLSDPAFNVFVIGEFKQGKSSLVNALLNAPVCPVDDDIATAVPTAIRFGDPPRGPIRPRWFAEGEHQVAHLARCQHFGLNALRLSRPTRFSTQSQFNLYAVLAGRGRLRWGDQERPLATGDVWLVPASCGYYHFEPEGGELQLLHELHRP